MSPIVERAARIVSQVSAIFALALLLVGPAAAQSSGEGGAKAERGDIFTIENVKVDVTAQNAAMARTMALAAGQRQAFDMLMRRLLRQEDRAGLPPIEPVQLNALVRGFEIAEERSSSVRYLANMTVRFDGAKVQDYLRARAVPFSQTAGKPVLVVPVMETAGLRLLWEDENAWRKAWAEHDLENRLLSFVLPAGGMEDRYLLPASQALDPGSPALRSIAARYGVERVITPLVEVRRDFATGGRIAHLTVLGEDGPLPLTGEEFALAEGEDLAKALSGAVEAVISGMDDRWKEQTLIRLDESGDLALTVPLRQVADWPEVGRRLDRVTLVQGRQLVSFRVGEAQIRLRYVGAREQITVALAQASLLLHEKDGTDYLLLEEVAQDMGLRLPGRRSEESR